jgi:hypothetical protein
MRETTGFPGEDCGVLTFPRTYCMEWDERLQRPESAEKNKKGSVPSIYLPSM